ncbi:FAD-binding oxidoreductase [Streptomyces sp. AgN23]|nr:FAD-binding oxidoreductase [Streptomyces sp. AgN23]
MSPSTARSAESPTAEEDTRLTRLLAACVSDPARVTTDVPRRLAAAHDASPYLFTPRAVVRAASAAEVGALMAGAQAAGLPLTLRSGGTSLAGQARARASSSTSAATASPARRHGGGPPAGSGGAGPALG